MCSNVASNEFDICVKDAANYLKEYKYEEAYERIMKAIYLDPNAPEPQNLLGIWYEFKEKNDLARKHYRMAYVLNPLYKPSSVNLERVSTLFSLNKIEVDFGDNICTESNAVNKEWTKNKFNEKQIQ